jgi:hypothetical protein
MDTGMDELLAVTLRHIAMSMADGQPIRQGKLNDMGVWTCRRQPDRLLRELTRLVEEATRYHRTVRRIHPAVELFPGFGTDPLLNLVVLRNSKPRLKLLVDDCVKDLRPEDIHYRLDIFPDRQDQVLRCLLVR